MKNSTSCSQLASVPLLDYRDSFLGRREMSRPTRIVRSPREHFMSAVDDEFSKFERQERALRQAEREERAAKLKLPVSLATKHLAIATSSSPAR